MTADATRARADVALELVAIPGGVFLMGDDSGRPDERPAHQVRLDAFAAARLPVTNRDYEVFLGATGHDQPRFWHDRRFNAPLQPVVAVSWHDALAYCDWQSERIGRRCRLPTEAEWEYAARGGRAGEVFPWGDDPLGWSADPSLALVRHEQPNPVGLSRANGFGLLDMGYNIHEWCSDWYAPDYYAASPDYDPHGPERGTRRASRGGAWRHQIQVCRNAARSSLDPTFRYNDYGFRVFADE